MIERPILVLTAKDFYTGISAYPQLPGQGLWQTCGRLNPFITPGVLKIQSAVTDLTASVVVDNPIASAANSTFLYVLGHSGHFYEIADVNTAPVVTDRRSASPITNPVAGMAVFQPNGGTKYLYYWQETKIGRWDFTAGTGGFTDNYIGSGGSINTALQSSTFHPVHKMFDSIFYGNLDRIGQIQDDGAGSITSDTGALDLPTESTVTALSDDGYYLIAAVSRGTSSSALYQRSKVIFWDRTSSSWQKEWQINDPIISAMQEKGGLIYALGSRGVYVFNYATPPKLLRTDVTATYGYPRQMDLYNDAVVMGTYTFGKVIPGVPNALFNIYGSQMSGSVSMVDTGASSNFTFFGTTSAKLYYFTNNSALGVATNSGTFTTVYIPLGARYQISSMVIVRDIPLTSTEDITFSVRTSATESDCVFTHMSYTNHGDKRGVRIYPDSSTGPLPVGDAISIEMNRDAGVGSMRIKQIEIYGEPNQNN